ncbi:MAG: hypothetical protein LBK67_13155 [Coriobacteriales bacterium]|jgi:hypothetical protein|nr:hypothetical protein [Coriobacteriales bacterium]
MAEQIKIQWCGQIVSIQPRSNVWRYRLDNRTHSHAGYNLFINGEADGSEKTSVIAISEIQQQKLGFRIGDIASGTAWTKKYPKWEYADYYRAGALKRIAANDEPIDESSAPPWQGPVPELAVYAWRGARILSKASWQSKCFKCKWAAMANVAIEYDWGISQKRRFESFCYGPKSCKYYKFGKAPLVPYKNCGADADVGWLDEIITENRGWDD